MSESMNPYAPTLEANAAAQQRRDAMAARLVQAQAPAPVAYQPPTVDQGGGAVGGGGNPLAGVDLKQLAEMFAKQRAGSADGFGGVDGYRTGYMGTGFGGANTGGADALQGMGFYNPLPAS